MTIDSFKCGDKVQDRDGFIGTIVEVTEWEGSHWYEVRFSHGSAIRYDGDLSSFGGR